MSLSLSLLLLLFIVLLKGVYSIRKMLSDFHLTYMVQRWSGMENFPMSRTISFDRPMFGNSENIGIWFNYFVVAE